jgi:hypothetical protein
MIRQSKRAGRKDSASPLRKTRGRAASKKRTKDRKTTRKWSGAVNQESNALDLQDSIFKSASASRIARSLKASADASHRRKGTPFQSAMSMLNFYINRGGANLSPSHKRILERAKDELRKVFHRST